MLRAHMGVNMWPAIILSSHSHDGNTRQQQPVLDADELVCEQHIMAARSYAGRRPFCFAAVV